MRHVTSAMGVLLLGVSTFMAGSWVPQPAHAVLGGGGCSACAATVRSQHSTTRNRIRDEHRSTRETIVEEIRQQTEELIEAMQLQTAELGSRMDRQVEAARRISDAEQQNATFRQRQQFRAEAESGQFDPNPFVCSLIDMFGSGAGTSGPGQAPMGAQVVSDRTAFYTGAGMMADEVRVGGSRLARSLNDERTRLSESLPERQWPTTDFGIVFDHPTMDDDEDVQQAMVMAITNLFGPPPAPISEDQLSTPSGQAESLNRDRIMAMQRAAEQPISFAMNLRDPVPEANVQAFREEAEDSAYNLPIGDNLSEMQMLDIRTVAQYAPSADRLNEISTMNDNQMLVEIYKAMAINNRLSYLNLETQLRNGTVLAAIAGANTPSANELRN